MQVSRDATGASAIPLAAGARAASEKQLSPRKFRRARVSHANDTRYNVRKPCDTVNKLMGNSRTLYIEVVFTKKLLKYRVYETVKEFDKMVKVIFVIL